MRRKVLSQPLPEKLGEVVTQDSDKKSSLHIDSNSKKLGDYSSAFYVNSNKIVNKQITKLGINEVDLLYNIGNINESNNLFTFETPNGTSTIELDIKNYENITDLANEILTKMNAQQNVFSVIIGDTSFTITGIITFRFLHSLGTQNSDCTGIFSTDSQALSIEFFPTLQYTRYLDFVTNNIKDSVITRDTFGSINQFSEKDHFARVFIDSDNSGITYAIPRKIVKKYKHIHYFPTNPRDIDDLNIRVYTDKQQPIYLKVNEVGIDMFEVKLLVYGLTFSMSS